MGGKSPAIVTKDTNLKGAAKRIVFGKFLNSGQTCIAPDYVVIDEKVKEEFLQHLKFYIEKFDYSFANGNYIQIINDRLTVNGHIKDPFAGWVHVSTNTDPGFHKI